jgi:hypothetical protein
MSTLLTLTDLALFIAGVLSWTISPMSAGSGSTLLMAAIAPLLRRHAIAPVIILASTVAGPVRAILFWHSIEWTVVSMVPARRHCRRHSRCWVLSKIDGRLVQVGVGLFLISTLLRYRQDAESMGELPLPFGNFARTSPNPVATDAAWYGHHAITS